MNEKPLERLNYYNGQRLQAADLKLEQDYHIRVRRWLNRSLYSQGIAEGLCVYAIKGKAKVRVTPGLAIDHLGREIILLEEEIVDVVGTNHDHEGHCDGPYLTIRYQEQIVGKQDLSCSVGGHGTDRAAWGGPGRILTGAVLELHAELPNEASGRIPLACLTLASGCDSIESVDLGVRRYIGDGSANKVKQYALEGVRDIDANNNATIIFHVRGRQPTSVALFVKAELLPSLYYTEVGHHIHANSGTLSLPPHTHGSGLSGPEGGHTPTVTSVKANVDAGVWNGALGLVGGAAGAAVGASGGITPAAAGFGTMGTIIGTAITANFINSAVNPDSSFMDLTLSPNIFHHRPGMGDPNNQREILGTNSVNMAITLRDEIDHQHSITSFPETGNWVLPLTGTGSGVSVGATDTADRSYGARTSTPLTYVKDLQFKVDGNPLTEAVRLQIINHSAQGADWAIIGSGTKGHDLVRLGTGEIRIDYLPGVVLGEGEHTIELSVTGDGNGGRIHFNLYVE